jgi:GTPase SAR1 family protein
MVYDVNNRQTFESCRDHWLPSYREIAPETSVIILIGNQIDRCEMNDDFREVQKEEAE